MTGLEGLLAGAGVGVTLLVIVAMILITPRGAVGVRRTESNLSGAADEAGAAVHRQDA